MASNLRLGPGPVFAYEWLTRSRRWQAYALRVLFVLALLLGLGMVYRSSVRNSTLTPRQQMAEAGEAFFITMAITQLAMILLAAPAATAGAICLDKARGDARPRDGHGPLRRRGRSWGSSGPGWSRS